MKTRTFFPRGFFCLAMGCLCIGPGASTALRAQQPTPPTAPPSTLVAVVDLPKIFAAHPTFKAKMEKVQQQLKTMDQQLQAKQKELSARNKQLTNLNPTSADYRRLEAELARQVADLQVEARQAKKEFMQREALQYYAAYKEIVSAVHQVAEQYNIGLVLRFDSTEIDPQHSQSVAQGMSRSVVVQRDLDITRLVTKELELALAQRNDQDRTPRR